MPQPMTDLLRDRGAQILELVEMLLERSTLRSVNDDDEDGQGDVVIFVGPH